MNEGGCHKTSPLFNSFRYVRNISLIALVSEMDSFDRILYLPLMRNIFYSFSNVNFDKISVNYNHL
jgi:hypothetical protein